MLFFGSSCENLCMMQFSLISLIPNLICKLQDCADPAFDNNERSMEMPTSVKTSDRSSCKDPQNTSKIDQGTNEILVMAFAGLPLHLFGKVFMELMKNLSLFLSYLTTGQPLWAIHAVTATGSAGRSWNQILRGWIY